MQESGSGECQGQVVEAKDALALELLTSSRAKCRRRCQREEHYAYGLGYRPVVEAEALRFGSLFHVGLEAWWKALEGSLLADALAAVEAKASNVWDLAKARAMLVGYDARWRGDRSRFEVLGVEERFEAPLRNPTTGAASRTFRAAGKLDVRVRDLVDGQVKVTEHKTSAEDISVGADYWAKLRLDGQVSIYFDGAASLGTPAASCIYDVAAKPTLRPKQVPLVDEAGIKIVLGPDGQRVKTANGRGWRQTGDTALGFMLQTRDETPEEYEARLLEDMRDHPNERFARVEVVRLEDELDEARWDLWQLATQMREARRCGFHPRNPDACMRYSRRCDYFEVCTGAASLDDPERFKRLDCVHPELEQEGQQ